MTKEQLDSYLKEKLEISIDYDSWDGVITVSLKLDMVTISSDTFSVPSDWNSKSSSSWDSSGYC